MRIITGAFVLAMHELESRDILLEIVSFPQRERKNCAKAHKRSHENILPETSQHETFTCQLAFWSGIDVLNMQMNS